MSCFIEVVNWIFVVLTGAIIAAYILKAKKFAEPPFQSKKIAEKVGKSGRHFWVIWGNFGPFWIILGHSRVIVGHLGPFWIIVRIPHLRIPH